MNDWYEATGTVRNAKSRGSFLTSPYRNRLATRPSKDVTTRPKQLDPYYCKAYGDRKHWPVYGYVHPGEKIMRTDDCVYCAQRIISLYTGHEWDDWRTVSSVRPSMIIEESPF